MREKVWQQLLKQQKIQPFHLIEEESFLQTSFRLISSKILTQQDIYCGYACSMHLPIIHNIDYELISKELALQVPYAFAKAHVLVPLYDKEDVITVAIANPFDVDSVDALRLSFQNKRVAIACADSELISKIQEYCYQQEHGAASQLIDNIEHVSAAYDTKIEILHQEDLLDVHHGSSPIVSLVHLILTEAITQGASDVHIEPFEKTVSVRYRIDGILIHRHSLDRHYQEQIATRFKVMAQLDVTESRLPQDGRIKLTLGSRQVDLRLSFIPVIHGERIVIRLLDCSSLQLGLNVLGIEEAQLQTFRSCIHRCNGIILVTGPTGSGKTTTLYSSVMEIDKTSLNIMTIEDPVEYKLPGIAQMGVHHKINLDFSAGLRHILRQDPDVIMIGEIRDLETAQIAIQAALTGHLVLSTLHTNDAASAITRLVEMGIEPYLLSSSMIAVLAQRLVRKICTYCMQKKEDQKNCKYCYGVGYRGRIGIYELMPISRALQKSILQRSDAHILKALAMEEGMQDLLHQGTQLVENGVTTKEELLRVLSM